MKTIALWSLFIALLLPACGQKRVEVAAVSGIASTPDANDPKTKTLPKPVADVLRDAKEIQLMSLFWVPLDDRELPAEIRGRKRIDGFPILGTSDVSDKKQQIVAALVRGVAENSGQAASCFDPRHALRVKTADGRTAELIICFECLQISATVQGHGRFDMLTSGYAAPLLDRLLRRAKIRPYVPPANW